MSAVIQDTAQNHGQPLVSLRNLNKYYGEFAAVDNISLDIKDGEFLTFLGSSFSASCWNLFLYTVLWLIPGLLTALLAGRA